MYLHRHARRGSEERGPTRPSRSSPHDASVEDSHRHRRPGIIALHSWSRACCSTRLYGKKRQVSIVSACALTSSACASDGTAGRRKARRTIADAETVPMHSTALMFNTAPNWGQRDDGGLMVTGAEDWSRNRGPSATCRVGRLHGAQRGDNHAGSQHL